MSEIFLLGRHDYIKGLITTVFAASLTVLVTITQQPDFSVFTTDWAMVFGNVLNVSVITLVSYLMKNALTNSEGNFYTEEPKKKKNVIKGTRKTKVGS